QQVRRCQKLAMKPTGQYCKRDRQFVKSIPQFVLSSPMTASPAVSDAFHVSETLWRRPWQVVDSILLAIILLFAVAVRAPTIDRPFHRNVEGVGSFYGILARNYLRHGLRETWGVPIQSLGRNDFDAPRLYAHHPPLVPLFVAASYKIFGEGD